MEKVKLTEKQRLFMEKGELELNRQILVSQIKLINNQLEDIDKKLLELIQNKDKKDAV